MRLNDLKYILLLILLGYAGHAVLPGAGAPEPAHKSSRFCFSEAKNLAQDDQDEMPKLRRKYKAKGLQVIVPLISALTFKKFMLRSGVSFITRQQACSSFLHCVGHKRGPPCLSI